MRVLFFLLLLNIISVSLAAQDSLFAYLPYRETAGPFAPPPVDGPKYDIAKAVFDQLVDARGDFRTPPPQFVMNKGEQYIAWMHPGRREVGLEEKAYDLCRKFGPDSTNAIAILLAHELVHYYEKHDWNRHFVAQRNDHSTSSARERMESIQLETEADYLGGILALSAGYNPYGVAENFLAVAYAQYDYPIDLKGYPDLAERQRLQRETAQRLAEMHNVFEMANGLTMLEAYELAQQYFDRILFDFQSYEIFNNAGVNAARAALSLYSASELPFVFPFELNLESRLQQIAIRLPERAEARRAEWLRKAERNLISAMQLAPDNPTPQMNLALVYAIQNKWTDAAFYAERAEQRSRTPKAAADARIVQGIIYGLQGDSTTATVFFGQALRDSPGLAQRNLDALQQAAPPPLRYRPAHPSAPETIDGLFAGDFLENPIGMSTTTVAPQVFCGKKVLDNSEILLHYARDGAQYVYLQRTLPHYRGTTLKGVQLDDHASTVRKAYGTPDEILQLPDGQVWRYDSLHLIFQFNNRLELQQWMIFRKEYDTANTE